ncbi:MAG: flippase [Anaerolineae bacterium]
MSVYRAISHTSRRIAQNTGALSFAQVARVGFNTLLTLFIARKLGAEGLGKYAVLVSYVQIFQTLAMAGVPRLVVREMARRLEARTALFQRMLVNQAIGAGAAVLLFVTVAGLLNHPADTTQALKIASLSLLPFAVASASEATFRAQEKMGYIALAQTVAYAAQTAAAIAALLAGYGIEGVAWAMVAGQCLMAVVETVIAGRLGMWRAFRVEVKKGLRLFRQSAEFFVVTLSVVVFSRLDVLVLSQMVGEREAGLYNAAYLVIRVINFASISYSDAIYPVLSRMFQQGRRRFTMLFSRSLVYGSLLALGVSVGVALGAGTIIRLLYQSPEYRTSVLLLQIEAPLVVILLWNALFSKALMASNLQRWSMAAAGAKLAVGFACYLILTARMGAAGTAWATVIAGLVGAILNCLFLVKNYNALAFGTWLFRPHTYPPDG